MRLIVGMTGATGALLGIRLLEHLAPMPEVETHLVLSRWARTTIELETGMSVAAVGKLGPWQSDQPATVQPNDPAGRSPAWRDRVGVDRRRQDAGVEVFKAP